MYSVRVGDLVTVEQDGEVVAAPFVAEVSVHRGAFRVVAS